MSELSPDKQLRAQIAQKMAWSYRFALEHGTFDCDGDFSLDEIARDMAIAYSTLPILTNMWPKEV